VEGGLTKRDGPCQKRSRTFGGLKACNGEIRRRDQERVDGEVEREVPSLKKTRRKTREGGGDQKKTPTSDGRKKSVWGKDKAEAVGSTGRGGLKTGAVLKHG